MKNMLQRCLLLSVITLFPLVSFGQAAASGADGWTGRMQQLNLFRLRTFSTAPCGAGEVQMGIPYNNSTRGICVETASRGLTTWEDARNTCLAANKRLPEPSEWLFFCKNAGTLGITVDLGTFEWISNFLSYADAGSLGYLGFGAAVAGGGSCSRVTNGFVLTNPAGGPQESAIYRCVRGG